MLSGVLCFRRPPPSGPIVSNFLGGIKRGRNVTGALYGARINDGVVTDLETPSYYPRAIPVTESKYTTIYTFCNDDDDNGNEDDDQAGKPSTVIERSLFVYGNQSVSPRR